MLALASPEDTSQLRDYRQILDLRGFMLVPGDGDLETAQALEARVLAAEPSPQLLLRTGQA